MMIHKECREHGTLTIHNPLAMGIIVRNIANHDIVFIPGFRSSTESLISTREGSWEAIALISYK